MSPAATAKSILLVVSVSPLSLCNSAWWWFMASWASWLNHWTERQVALPRHHHSIWPSLGNQYTPVSLSVVSAAQLSFYFSLGCFPFSSRIHCLEREVPLNWINLHGYGTVELGFKLYSALLPSSTNGRRSVRPLRGLSSSYMWIWCLCRYWSIAVCFSICNQSVTSQQ